jgi:hypothetical protein
LLLYITKFNLKVFKALVTDSLYPILFLMFRKNVKKNYKKAPTSKVPNLTKLKGFFNVSQCIGKHCTHIMHYSNTNITFSLLSRFSLPSPSLSLSPLLHNTLIFPLLSLCLMQDQKHKSSEEVGFCRVLAEIGKAIEVHRSQSPMGFTMGLNLLLLVAIVATNVLSLNHFSSTLQTSKRPPSPAPIRNPPPLSPPLHYISSYTATLPPFPHRHCLPQPPGPPL